MTTFTLHYKESSLRICFPAYRNIPFRRSDYSIPTRICLGILREYFFRFRLKIKADSIL